MNKVFIVDGLRSPFMKARGKGGPFSASDLGTKVSEQLFLKLDFDPTLIDEAVVGCMSPSPNEANIARIIARRAGCGDDVPAHTVQRNCASGLQALGTAFDRIALGESDLILAGGTEVMSRAPLQWGQDMTDWFTSLMYSRTMQQRLTNLIKFRPHMLKPVITLLCGLTDPFYNIGMGQTAEIVADKFSITREMQDEFAVQSNLLAAEAMEAGVLDDEIVTVYADNGKMFAIDDGVRFDSNIEKLAKLRPAFDKKYGTVTSANSSQITDGAAMLLLASEEAATKYDLNPIAEIIGHNWASVDPREMGLGPVPAVNGLLDRHDLHMLDLAHMELNEAFAAQSLGCMAQWQYQNRIGKFDVNRINPHGGAISIGHPVGASGARITLHLAKSLNKDEFGVATLCIGGGQGGAMLVKGV